MGLVVDLGKRLKIEVRIDLRGRYARVAEHLLNRAQILRGLQHMACEGVAQYVRMDAPVRPLRLCPGVQSQSKR